MATGERIIGIDLGTTNSVVAVMEGNEVKVIPNPEGNRLMPSVVAFLDSGKTLVGEPAKRQAVTNPTRTVASIKRFMGRRHKEVAEDKMVPYKVTGSNDDYVKVGINGELYAPPQVSAMILRKLKEAAEAYLGHRVNKAVITVPAYFNDAQRQATKDAGQIAGLEVARLISDSVAASLAYGLDKNVNQTIVVFDLGGGTFDVSCLEIADGVFQVLSTNGDTHLGGDDFDKVLINYVAQQFQSDSGQGIELRKAPIPKIAQHLNLLLEDSEQGIELRKYPIALQRLQEACEQAKRELISAPSTDINLPFITADQNGPKHLHVKLTRAIFEQLTDHLLERCREPVLLALKDANKQPSQIDEIVLVGGSTRIPKVQDMVRAIFNKEPHKGVNPDEVVAVGAAIQGAVLAGEVRDVLLLDVTPFSLGIKMRGGIMTKLVERNTTIPTEKKQVFSTAVDNRTTITIKVFQGEQALAANNRLLGQFNLEGLPPAPRGVPQIEVAFDLDTNGILNVSAKDLGTGKETKVRIEQSSGRSEAAIEKMKRDAETQADEDKQHCELVEAKNNAESMCFQLDKLLKEHDMKLNPSHKDAITSSIGRTREAIATDDLAQIKSATEQLEQASHAMSKAMFEAARA